MSVCVCVIGYDRVGFTSRVGICFGLVSSCGVVLVVLCG